MLILIKVTSKIYSLSLNFLKMIIITKYFFVVLLHE